MARKVKTKLSEFALIRLSHIASRGIGLSLFSDSNGWIPDSSLARQILADAGYSKVQISDLAFKCSGLAPTIPSVPVGQMKDH